MIGYRYIDVVVRLLTLLAPPRRLIVVPVTTTAKTDDVVLYYRAIVALRDALRWQSYPASSPSGRWEDDAW